MAKKRKYAGGTEFEGRTGPSGVHLKDPSALSASERLRLIYTVGEEDPKKAPNDRAWNGLSEKPPRLDR